MNFKFIEAQSRLLWVQFGVNTPRQDLTGAIKTFSPLSSVTFTSVLLRIANRRSVYTVSCNDNCKRCKHLYNYNMYTNVYKYVGGKCFN